MRVTQFLWTSASSSIKWENFFAELLLAFFKMCIRLWAVCLIISYIIIFIITGLLSEHSLEHRFTQLTLMLTPWDGPCYHPCWDTWDLDYDSTLHTSSTWQSSHVEMLLESQPEGHRPKCWKGSSSAPCVLPSPHLRPSWPSSLPLGRASWLPSRLGTSSSYQRWREKARGLMPMCLCLPPGRQAMWLSGLG